MQEGEQEDWTGRIGLEESIRILQTKDLVLVVDGLEREATLDQVYSGEVQVAATEPDVGLYAGRITVKVYDRSAMNLALDAADNEAQRSLRLAGSSSDQLGLGRPPSTRPQPDGPDRKVEIHDVNLSYDGGRGANYWEEKLRLSGIRRRPDTGSENASSDEYWVTINFHDFSILRLDQYGTEVQTGKRYFTRGEN